MADVLLNSLGIERTSHIFDNYISDCNKIGTEKHKKKLHHKPAHVRPPIGLLNKHQLLKTNNTKHRSSKKYRSFDTVAIKPKKINQKEKIKHLKTMSRPSTPIITLDYTNVIVQDEPDEDTMNYVPSAFVGNAPVEIGECIVLSAGQELLYKDELQKYIASHQDHPIFTMIECEPEDEEEGFDEEEEEEEDEDKDEEDEEDYSGYAGHRDNGGSAFALYYVEEPVSSQRELYNTNKHSSNYGFDDYSENASDGFDFLEDGSDGSVYTYTYSTYQVEELDDEVEDVDMF